MRYELYTQYDSRLNSEVCRGGKKQLGRVAEMLGRPTVGPRNKEIEHSSGIIPDNSSAFSHKPSNITLI